jgi:hypothetical protein
LQVGDAAPPGIVPVAVAFSDYFAGDDIENGYGPEPRVGVDLEEKFVLF